MSLWLKGQDWTVASLDELLMCHGKVDWVGVAPPHSPWKGSRSDFSDCCEIVIDGVVAGTTTSILPAYCAQRLSWSGGVRAASGEQTEMLKMETKRHLGAIWGVFRSLLSDN
jgi:hypothetical protein